MAIPSAKLTLATSLEQLVGVGPAYAKKLHRLGLNSARDLLTYLPRRYDDFSKLLPIAQTRIGEIVTVRARLLEIKARRSSRRRMMLTEAVVADDSGMVKLTWFNQPYLAKSLHVGDELMLSGKIEHRFGELQMTSPEYELVKQSGEQVHTAGIVPVYSETEGLSSKWLRSRVKPLLHLVNEIPDPLPEETRARNNLLGIASALREVHFPENEAALERARERFDFEELFMVQLLSARIKLDNRKYHALPVPFDKDAAGKFSSSLGFALTDSQKRSAWQVLQDIEKEVPMNRLIEGDVGSGKTVVAAMALHQVALSGCQGALMAPTEVLAVQHGQTIRQILNPLDIKVALLSHNYSEIDGQKIPRLELLNEILKGGAQVVIGTHALFGEDVHFHKLALAIIDEQHRFGVEQRALLRRENEGILPHLLSMTATPIPRTLTLTVYGDLDLSVINELPAGRTPIETKRVLPDERDAAYSLIRKELEAGRQAFIVCPVIEESEALAVRSAKQEYELQQKIFPEFKVGLLHGKLKAAERKEVMEEFVSGRSSILVATSIIEVGVDVPNATVMVIEGADRFGLSQLHQIRGRVGRGSKGSYCFLFSDSKSEETKARLDAVVSSNSGFELAEADLQLRGPGEIYGTRQSGLPEVRAENLLNHALIQKTREEAEQILNQDPELKGHRLLRERLEEILVTKHLE
jgi:ATP-dependent DNA helicase RecG